MCNPLTRRRRHPDPNGCGPWFLGDHDFLDGPDGAFESPCLTHDRDYAAGGGERDRWRADWRLYTAMRRAIRRHAWHLRAVGELWALAYLALVLLFGWTTYTYKETP